MHVYCQYWCILMSTVRRKQHRQPTRKGYTQWIKKAIQTHRQDGMMWYLARDYALYADLLKRKDDPLGVRESLTRALEMFKECGADGWVNKTEKELAACS